MGGCPRLGFVLEIYKKSDQKDIANFRLISLLNIDYKFHAKLFKTNMKKKTWDTIIGKNQSTAVESRSIFHSNDLSFEM